MFTYPIDCNTPAERTEYAYRSQELLRLLHNKMGEWYRDGIIKSDWDRLPIKIQKRYLYQPRLFEEKWKDFKTSLFEPASTKIADAITTQRELLKASTKWSISNEVLV